MKPFTVSPVSNVKVPIPNGEGICFINEPNLDSSYILDFGDTLELQLIGQKNSIDELSIKRDGSINIPEGTSSTIAGYIIDQTESFPDVGQTFAYDGIMYEIINKNKNLITQIKLTLPKKITTH